MTDTVSTGRGKEEKQTLFARLFDSSQETPTPVEAEISGLIPEWLSGVFFRNGPGQYEIGEYPVNASIDGFALLNKFEISRGTVRYSSRFMQSKAYVDSTEAQRLVYHGVGTLAIPDPCKNIFQRFLADFTTENTDNCNVNFVKLDEDYFALTESTKLVKVDPSRLNVEATVDMANYVDVNTSSAHPHYGEDGDIFSMGSSYGRKTFYNIIKIPKSNEADGYLMGASILCKIPATSSLRPSYYHSFAMTKNFFVFIEQSVTLNVPKILVSKLFGWDPSQSIGFDSKRMAKLVVIRREDGAILPRIYETDPMMCLHHINAYEEDNHIVVDACCYDDGAVLKNFSLRDMRNGGAVTKSLAKRFILPLEAIITTSASSEDLVTLSGSSATASLRNDGTVRCNPEVLCDIKSEMPRINYDAFNGKKYRYFYSVGSNESQIMKVDVVTKTQKLWSDHDCFVSEPIFVPRPDSLDEDDGVVLCSIIDTREGERSYLVILDGKTFEELARATVPADVPIGLHGIFIDN